MSIVRNSALEAQNDLGLSERAVRKLVHARLIDHNFDLPGKQRWVEYDPSWSRKDIWDRRVAKGFDFSDEIEVDGLISAKRALGCGEVFYTDEFLLALGQVLAGREMLKRDARKRFGRPEETWQAACKRYNELHDGHATDGASHPPMELEDALEGAPEELQKLRGSCVDERSGILFEKPEPVDVARVGAMAPGHIRWLATLAILTYPSHGGFRGRMAGILRLIERIGQRIGKGVVSDADLMGCIMHELYAAPTGSDVAAIKSYADLRSLVLAYLEWQVVDREADEAAFLRTLLPAELPDDLRRISWDERELMSLDALKQRAIRASEIVRRVGARLLCVEARLRQWERLTQVIDNRIERIEEDLAAGKPVQFPIGVSDTYKVIRPDGSLAAGLRQTVRVEIFTEDALWLETVKGSGWDPTFERHLSAHDRSMSPARLERTEQGGRKCRPPIDGQSYRDGGNRRYFVCYAGTDQADHHDDECYPPHVIELYASSALVYPAELWPAQRLKRNEVVQRHNLEWSPRAMLGLNWWPGREGQGMAHSVLQHTGRIMLPYRQIRLMLAYGCAVARFELMTGLRIGETMQARHGGCFRELPLGDRKVATMRGRPKGWPRDRLWIIDKDTMALVKKIKGWVIENWHSDIGELPIVSYGERNKNLERLQCPTARYLFLIGNRAAKSEHLNRCLRIATLGMPHAQTHDYRYAFGKLLGLKKATRRQSARALSHELDSLMVEQYRDWEYDGLEDDDAIVAALQEQTEAELMDGWLDAA